MFAIQLPPSIEKRFDKLARRTGRTKTSHVREAILNHLEDFDHVYTAERAGWSKISAAKNVPSLSKN